MSRKTRAAYAFAACLVASCGSKSVTSNEGDASATDTGTTIDAAPLTCTITTDPCFAQYAAELGAVEKCMGHPDTCAASGNTDASGCGHESRNPDGSETCSWPDGAHQDATLSGTLTVVGVNATGATCFMAEGRDAGSASTTTTFSFPDGKKFVVHSSSTPPNPATVDCPDGSTSRSFTDADVRPCKIGFVCCGLTCT
jgi:hypothetical protein